MLKRILLISMAMLIVSTASCIFDPKSDNKECTDCVDRTLQRENLTQKWHVLNNIVVAYNKRDISIYDELLDDNFTFFLSPGDVGGTIPDQWGRADEILYNSRLFDPNYSGAHRCKTIEMDLTIPDDKTTISWVKITPASAPDETWYMTTVFYRFRFDTEPDTQYESVAGAKGEFTVRDAGTAEKPQWRLVEFRDLAEK